ncbi:thioredoxin-like protein [Daedaleopsis nitida]|nr:thioredoxin-like protein [Daedaleopsis nitida]KAI0747184.1 thioredoxin-like protein [Daedaleopsis nitida]
MVQPNQITLYTHHYAPYPHRVRIALEEAKAEYTRVDVDIVNKPAWYTEKVNPAGKVPAITFVGPPASPENPSPNAVKLTESLVIVEFIAELFPSSKLHPADLVKRARARLFITIVETAFFNGFKALFIDGASNAGILAALEALQARLAPAAEAEAEAVFAVGEWSIADVAVAPFLLRMRMMLEHEIGKYPMGEGRKTIEELETPKFARMKEYMEAVGSRPSVLATWNEAQVLDISLKNPAMKRD